MTLHASPLRRSARLNSSPQAADLPTTLISSLLIPELPFSGRASPHASSPRKYRRYWNINQFPIGYAFRPRLRGRLTLGKIALTLETFGFRRTGISPVFSLLMPAFSLPLPPADLSVHLLKPRECSPTPDTCKQVPSRGFGTTLSPVTLSAHYYSTSELLRTLSRCGCF